MHAFQAFATINLRNVFVALPMTLILSEKSYPAIARGRTFVLVAFLLLLSIAFSTLSAEKIAYFFQCGLIVTGFYLLVILLFFLCAIKRNYLRYE